MLPALDRLLDDPRNRLGVGVFGAIGEFVRDADEAAQRLPSRGLVTARGGIAIAAEHDAARLIAWTEPSVPGQWRQGAALCLPEAEAETGGTDVVAEIGPALLCLQPAHRDDILFDMGVGFAHLRACIRTADPWIIGLVRAGLWKAALRANNPALGAIIATSPHRVFRAASGASRCSSPSRPRTADRPKARTRIS